MYLSRIDMDLSDSYVRSSLKDAQKMHRLLTGLFQKSRQEASLLYRVKVSAGKVMVYQYSNTPVLRERLRDGVHLFGEREITGWLESMQEGQSWGFDIVTMPFKKEKQGEGTNSRRRFIKDQEERLEWLSRKASQNGFSILDVEEIEGEKLNIYHSSEKGGKMTMDHYRYSGRLVITDAQAFRNGIIQGIGPGKAYGLGMMLLVR